MDIFPFIRSPIRIFSFNTDDKDTSKNHFKEIFPGLRKKALVIPMA